MLLGDGEAQKAADRARALSDPTRLSLATALREGGELCVCDLSWIAERKQALVSHHLRTLRSEGLVSSRRDGKLVMYALTDEGRSVVRGGRAHAGCSLDVCHVRRGVHGLTLAGGGQALRLRRPLLGHTPRDIP